mgnify:CR=1 FL=1
MQRWDIPVEHFEAFLHSMTMDLTVTEYATYDDLYEYVYGSAAVIGLQMVPILEPSAPEAYERAKDLGVIAMKIYAGGALVGADRKVQPGDTHGPLRLRAHRAARDLEDGDDRSARTGGRRGEPLRRGDGDGTAGARAGPR